MADLNSYTSLSATRPRPQGQHANPFKINIGRNSFLSEKKGNDEKESVDNLLPPFKIVIMPGLAPVGLDGDNKNPVKQKIKKSGWVMPDGPFSSKSHFAINTLAQYQPYDLKRAADFYQDAAPALRDASDKVEESNNYPAYAQTALRFAPYIIGCAVLGYGLYKMRHLSKAPELFSETKPLQRVSAFLSAQINQKLDNAAIKIFGGDGTLANLNQLKLAVNSVPKTIGKNVLSELPNLMMENTERPLVDRILKSARPGVDSGAKNASAPSFVTTELNGMVNTVNGKPIDDIITDLEITRHGKFYDSINIPDNPNIQFENNLVRFNGYKANMAAARLAYESIFEKAAFFSRHDFVDHLMQLHRIGIEGITNYRPKIFNYSGQIVEHPSPVNYGILKEKASLDVLQNYKNIKDYLVDDGRYFTGINTLPKIKNPINFGFSKDEPYLMYGLMKKDAGEFLRAMSKSHRKAIKSILNPDSTLNDKLGRIANYYQYAISSHLFQTANNSIFMNQVNFMIKKSGLKPIMHGELDAMANILSQKDFERHFYNIVIGQQPKSPLRSITLKTAKFDIEKNFKGAHEINGTPVNEIVNKTEITRRGKNFDDRTFLTSNRPEEDQKRFMIYETNCALARLRFQQDLALEKNISLDDFLVSRNEQHSLTINGFDEYIEPEKAKRSLSKVDIDFFFKEQESKILLDHYFRSDGVGAGPVEISGMSSKIIVERHLNNAHSITYVRKTSNEDNSAVYDAYIRIFEAQDQSKALKAIATYYQRSIVSHPYGRANNSLFMNQVNALLKNLKLKPVRHGEIDGVANFMPSKDFSDYFYHYVMQQQ